VLTLSACGDSERTDTQAKQSPAPAPATDPQPGAAEGAADQPDQGSTADGGSGSEPASASVDPDPAPTTDAALAEVVADVQRLREAGEFRAARSQVGIALRNLNLTPEQAEPLLAMRQDLLGLERDAVQLRKAVELLGSDSAAEVGYASNLLRRGGEAARVLLRRAVREGESAAVGHAAELLGQLSDPLAANDLLDRLAADPPLPEPVVAAVYAALGKLSALESAAFYPRLYERFTDAAPAERRLATGALVDAFTYRADAEPAAFAELVGVEDAYAALTASIEEQMVSDDAAVVAWAQQAAAALGLAETGVRAAYFKGTDFGELLLERLEPAPAVSSEKLPIDRSEHISARWTGQLLVAEEGEYTFWSTADDGQRLYVDGKPLIDNWQMQPASTKSAEVRLSKGLHPFKVEWMQGSSGFKYELEWAGPGFERRPVSADDFRVQPWPAMERAGDGG